MTTHRHDKSCETHFHIDVSDRVELHVFDKHTSCLGFETIEDFRKFLSDASKLCDLHEGKI